MNSSDHISLVGKLTADPKLITTPKGMKHYEFVIALERFYKLDDEYQGNSFYVKIVANNPPVVEYTKSLKKGNEVKIAGRLKQLRNINENGRIVSSIYIIAEQVELKSPQNEIKTAQKKTQLQFTNQNNQPQYKQRNLGFGIGD